MQFNTFKSLGLSFLCSCFGWLSVTQAQPIQSPERGFISTQAAENWEQGLIAGNGIIGANVLSHPLDETVILSHAGLFMPMGQPLMPPDNANRLFEIRQLIDKGLYRQATELQFRLSGQEGFMYPDPFVPAFDLHIKMQGAGEVHDYIRSVNFENGETLVHWADSRGVFERRLFVSRADSIVVMHIKGPAAGRINAQFWLAARAPEGHLNIKKLVSSYRMFSDHISNLKTGADKNILTYSNDYSKAYPGSIHRLEGMAMIENKGGTISKDGDVITLNGASEVTLLLDMRLIYEEGKSVFNNLEHRLAGFTQDYQTLLERNEKVHNELFGRVKLDLFAGEDRKLTTEELLLKSTDKELNKALIEKEFDAGRYNIISCTGSLPPTLQGIWAGTYSPDWASDFTHNGNVPSAIANDLQGNMPELMLAYTSYIESIVPYLEINARNMFGARGVVLPSRSSTNGYNNALAPSFAGGFWVAGAPWAAHFFYDYYLFTGDRKFLLEHALPFMEKVAMFFEDYLYTGPDGKYIFSPTQSPENTPGNTNSQGTFNATMDVAATKELLRNLIEGSAIAGINKERIPVWKAMLEKMPDYMVSANGTIKEWLTPRLDNNDNHRHASQLYPLYYGLPAEIAVNPALMEAFKKTIEYKLDKHWKNNKIGYMSFGLVQLCQASISLSEPDLAYDCLKYLVNRFWLNNLASTHNHRSLFNMDVSGGMPSVIIDMLVGSEPGKIHLFRALPKNWDKGRLEGVLCRGQVEVKSLYWDGNTISLELQSSKDQTLQINLPQTIKSVSGTNLSHRKDKKSSARSFQVALNANKLSAIAIRLQ